MTRALDWWAKTTVEVGERLHGREVEIWPWTEMNIWEGYDQNIWTIRSKQKKATCGVSREKGKYWSIESYSICAITLVEQVPPRAGGADEKKSIHAAFTSPDLTRAQHTNSPTIHCVCTEPESEMSPVSITLRLSRKENSIHPIPNKFWSWLHVFGLDQDALGIISICMVICVPPIQEGLCVLSLTLLFRLL